jgi:hypothetical protein
MLYCVSVSPYGFRVTANDSASIDAVRWTLSTASSASEPKGFVCLISSASFPLMAE